MFIVFVLRLTSLKLKQIQTLAEIYMLHFEDLSVHSIFGTRNMYTSARVCTSSALAREAEENIFKNKQSMKHIEIRHQTYSTSSYQHKSCTLHHLQSQTRFSRVCRAIRGCGDAMGAHRQKMPRRESRALCRLTCPHTHLLNEKLCRIEAGPLVSILLLIFPRCSPFVPWQKLKKIQALAEILKIGAQLLIRNQFRMANHMGKPQHI